MSALETFMARISRFMKRFATSNINEDPFVLST